jgi:16S rRNA (guanine(966)-N(2))-methyltransferase RsmD
MRIISGTHKGRRITAPKQLPVRPTTDMAKEALFNILNNNYYFEDIKVLDLYAGTGNISYEFASRGCPGIQAVDTNAGCIRFIQATAQEFGFPISAIRSEVLSYLERSQQQFDIIFADPPYDQAMELFCRIPELVFAKELLTPSGLLVIEHSKHTDLSGLEFFEQQRKYGGSIFSFFRAAQS